MRLLALALTALLALAMAGCGGDDELKAVSPKTSPDLTIPTTPDDVQSADGDTATTDTTATTATTATDATGGTADDSGTGGTAPETATPTEPTAPETGGAEQGATTQPDDTGGAQAGDLSDFCQENPGAC